MSILKIRIAGGLAGALAGMSCTFGQMAQVLARDLPQGAAVKHGQVDFSIQGKTMRIEQGTSHAIVEWESFDVGRDYAVDLRQPSAQAAMLARVTGAVPSEIEGRLAANGGFYLINPHGILFGSGAVVDVNRLLATTRALSDQDFLDDVLRFAGEAPCAAVNNQGAIQAENVALIAREVINDGMIQAPQVLLAGASRSVRVENFVNGGTLCIDFSQLTAERETHVVNQGSIEAEGGLVILSAGGGNGALEAEGGTVQARTAEFSGRNAALSRLGDVSAEQIVIDPTADLVIGACVAQEAGLGYAFTDAAVGAAELEWPADAEQPEFTEGVGYGFHDADGNGWTYMRREANTLGGVLDSYTYFDPVLTYYHDGYLSGKLDDSAIVLDYSRQGTANGAITVADGVRLGGANDLTLKAEADLTLGLGVVRDSSGGVILQSGHDLAMGDLAMGGNLVAQAENRLTSGHLTATEIVLSAGKDLAMNEGAEASAGGLTLQGETAKLGGDFKAGQELVLSAGKVIVISKVSLQSGNGMAMDGDWSAERECLEFSTSQGDIRMNGEIRDARSVSASSAGGVLADEIHAAEQVMIEAVESVVMQGAVEAGEVKISAGNDALLNSSVKGSAVIAESIGGSVRVAGRLTSLAEPVLVCAGEDVVIGPEARVAGPEVRIQAAGRVRSQGTLAGEMRIALNGGKGLSAMGTLQAPLAECISGGDIMVQGTPDSAVECLRIFGDGVGAQVGLVWPADLKELALETLGAGSAVQASLKDVGGGRVVANGTNSSIQIIGENILLEQVASHSGEVSLEAERELVVGVVETEVSGNVRLQANGDVTVRERLVAAGDLAVSAAGRLVLEGQEPMVAGDTMELAAADFGDARSALRVSVGGRLYVDAMPGTKPRPFFARLEGKSADGGIHAHGHSVPGVVFFNGRVWMGRQDQMTRLDRAESELFSRICAGLRTEL
ncbi:MAG: filamentous hemagglutinin N-terminal domain-containing protein [Victivallales bacterium]|nr:filamentous hemagglutinin N-terminal domain-containing protein [Victivallales bacterium]